MNIEFNALKIRSCLTKDEISMLTGQSRILIQDVMQNKFKASQDVLKSLKNYCKYMGI